MCGAEASTADYLGPYVDLGVSLRLQAFSLSAGDDTGGGFRAARLLPALTIGSPTLTFCDGRCGANLVWNTTAFHFDRQTNPDDRGVLFRGTEDVGTSLEGWSTSIASLLCILWKGGWIEAGRAGLGVGVGYTHAEGEILANTRVLGWQNWERVADPELRRVEVDGWSRAFIAVLEARHDPLAVSFIFAAPFNGRDRQYYEASFAVSYSWYRRLRSAPPAAEGTAPPARFPARD